MTEHNISGVSNVSYTLKNEAGGIVGQQSGSPLSKLFDNLTPGDYKLTYTYRSNSGFGLSTISTVKKITVGVEASWNQTAGPISTTI